MDTNNVQTDQDPIIQEINSVEPPVFLNGAWDN